MPFQGRMQSSQKPRQIRVFRDAAHLFLPLDCTTRRGIVRGPKRTASSAKQGTFSGVESGPFTAPDLIDSLVSSASSHEPRAPEGSPYSAHIPALDGVRGLAVLGVMGSHLFPGTTRNVVTNIVGGTVLTCPASFMRGVSSGSSVISTMPGPDARERRRFLS
jgi:hypothetical protein